MANLRKSLEEHERFYGEPIEAMVVGKHYDRMFDDEARADENVTLSREDGLAKVDEEYGNGYGGAHCYPLYAWTASRIFLVHEYDGATGMVWVPRYPMAVKPDFGGQSILMDEIERRTKAESENLVKTAAENGSFTRD